MPLSQSRRGIAPAQERGGLKSGNGFRPFPLKMGSRKGLQQPASAERRGEDGAKRDIYQLALCRHWSSPHRVNAGGSLRHSRDENMPGRRVIAGLNYLFRVHGGRFIRGHFL